MHVPVERLQAAAHLQSSGENRNPGAAALPGGAAAPRNWFAGLSSSCLVGPEHFAETFFKPPPPPGIPIKKQNAEFVSCGGQQTRREPLLGRQQHVSCPRRGLIRSPGRLLSEGSFLNTLLNFQLFWFI